MSLTLQIIKPVSCGVIFYKIINNKIYLLLIKKNNKYSDIGGININHDYISSIKYYILTMILF